MQWHVHLLGWLLYLFPQEGLALQQALSAAGKGNACRPVVGQEDVQGPPKLHEAVHLQLTHMVGAFEGAPAVRWPPHMRLHHATGFKDQSKTSHGS